MRSIAEASVLRPKLKRSDEEPKPAPPGSASTTYEDPSAEMLRQALAEEALTPNVSSFTAANSASSPGKATFKMWGKPLSGSL